MMRFAVRRQEKALLAVVVTPAIAALFLLGVRVLLTSTFDYTFMIWNVTLSFMALIAAYFCAYFWSKKQTLWKFVSFFAWLLLLPNTFYMLTDYVHLGETNDINLIFDIVMLALFSITGFIHGCIALWCMHVPLIKRVGRLNAHMLIALTMIASSFAIDMGRFLRWNSWDVLLHPQSLLFDLTDTLLNPLNYNRSFLVTAVFFVAMAACYVPFWFAMQLFQLKPKGVK